MMSHEVPVGPIVVQAANFVLAVGLLVFLTRKSIAQQFKLRHEEFHQQAHRAEEARVEAEKRKQEILQKMNRIKEEQAETVSAASREGQALKQKMQEEAKQLVQKLEEDADKTMQYEYFRSLTLLRGELLSRSLDMAQERMRDEVDGADLQRLRGEFVEKIQVVR